MSRDPLDSILATVPPVRAPAPGEPYRTRKGALKYQPDSDWSLDRLLEVESEFQRRTGQKLPVSVRGQGRQHNKWNYAHDDSADIGLNPSSSEGQALLAQLQEQKIPFLAFDRAIPGVSTGAHIHVGRPSKRRGAALTSVTRSSGGDDLDALLQDVPPTEARASVTTARQQSDDLDQLLETIPSAQQPRRGARQPQGPFAGVTAGVQGQAAERPRIQVPDINQILTEARTRNRPQIRRIPESKFAGVEAGASGFEPSPLYRETREKVISEKGGLDNYQRTILDAIKVGQNDRAERIQRETEAEIQRRVKDFSARQQRARLSESGQAPQLGVWDKIRELGDNPAQLLPFISSGPEIAKLLRVGAAAQKLENLEQQQTKGTKFEAGGLPTEEDIMLLREFHAEQNKDTSFLYKVADTVSMLPAFVGEIAATGGTYKIGKEASLEGLKRLATKKGIERIEKNLAGRVATKSISALGGAALQTIPAGATRIPAGVLYREQEGSGFGEALRDTLADQFIEIASERSGGVLSHIPLGKRLSAIRDALTARWIAKAPGRTAEQLKKIVDRTGWHGPLGEVFEERVGDVARYATGLQESAIPSLEQLAIEGLAFSVPGAGLAVASKALTVGGRRAAEAQPEPARDVLTTLPPETEIRIPAPPIETQPPAIEVPQERVETTAPPEVSLPAEKPVDTRRPEDFLPSFFPRTSAPPATEEARDPAAIARAIFEGYDNTGELSESDVIDELEASELLPEAVAAYRRAQEDDREFGYRMDSSGETFEKEVLPPLQALIAGERSVPVGETAPLPSEKARALPKTLATAGMEKGENLTYTPATLEEGATAGRLMVEEKGVDGAIEHVLRGDAGIEWAPTGFAVLGELRAEEARRLENDPEGAAAASAKRRRFAGEFAERATELGQSIAGVRAIEEFAPDRATFVANKVSLKRRKKPLTAGEDARIVRISEDLQKATERTQYLEKALDTIKTRIEEKATSKRRAERLDYRSRLDVEAATIKQTLKPRVGKFDFGNLARPAERGELRLGSEPLPGDAELLAQYGAARLGKLDTVDALNAEMVAEFGREVKPYLPKIRQRAYRIRQEARLSEIENSQTEPKRRRTILQEIQKEISEAQRAVDDAAKAEDSARKGALRQASQEQRAQARAEASTAKSAEREWNAEEAAQERARLTQLRREYREASKAQTQGYRQTIGVQREAARKAELWDTPIRDAANAARQRLVNADPKSPDTLNALVDVAAEKLLPTKIGGTGRMGAVRPTQLYIQLHIEFPELVTRKSQDEIYKRAYQKIQDMTSAAREAATLRSASAESRRLWDQLGLDSDTQAILIQRAEARREQLEARREMAAEFVRVSRTTLGKVLFEVQSIPRALQSSIDAPIGRQGMFYLITHPVETARFTVPATIKGYTSFKRGEYARRVSELEAHPYYDLARRAGVDLTQVAGASDPRITAEESFQSTLAEKLPHVRLSQQGFTLGMNAQRVYAFERYARLGESQGYTWESRPEFFQQAAELINDATGRGNMRDSIKRMSALTNAVFYSTRLNISRLQLLNDFINPVKIKNYDPVMRRIVAGELIRLAVGMGVIYGTAKMLGLGVTMDPDDPDFGKVVWGRTHYDVTGGQAATIRFLFRELRGVYALATGEKLPYNQDPFTVVNRFMRQKLAPWPSAAIDFMYGKNVIGQPANLKVELSKPAQTMNENIAVRMITPFVVGDFSDAAALDGWIGVGKNAPALAGVGVAHYEKNSKPKTKGSKQ